MHAQAATAPPLFALASQAYAETRGLTIGARDQRECNMGEFKLAACMQVKLTLKHAGKLAASVMGHNWVPTRTADFGPIVQAGMAAGLANSFVSEGDARPIAHDRVNGGGENASATFCVAQLKKGGDSRSSVPPRASDDDERQAGRGMNH